jgi:predicted small secreted protein
MRNAAESRPSRALPDARVAVLLAALLLPACDTFFGVSGRVTDCAQGTALANVSIDVHVDRGYQDRMESLTDVAMTNADGAFSFDLNDPQDSWATLTLRRLGYQSLTPAQFQNHSSQDPPVALCMNAAPTP